MQEPITIPQFPTLLPSEDYYFLRQKGLEYIERLGSRFWTDYNLHDPGITILELLCYAETELGYRTSFNTQDLLAAPLALGGQDQGFFTAAKILANCPWTLTDFRKVLIDLPRVRNAWLFCKECPCEVPVYANCETGTLTYGSTDQPVVPKGMYDVLLEMEEDAQLGDFNNGKLKHVFSLFLAASNRLVTTLLEVRFPGWAQVREEYPRFKNFLAGTSALVEKGVTVTKIAKLTAPDTDLIGGTVSARDLRLPLVVSLEIRFLPDREVPGTEETLVLENVPFTVFPDRSDSRRDFPVADLVAEFQNTTENSLLRLYHRKLSRIQNLLREATNALHATRNLSEDYCRVSPVAVEDIAVCADVELTPEADVEKVLASIYFEVEQYFNPALRFYGLQELLEEGLPVEEIFNGPGLRHGFLKTDEVEAAQLRKNLYTSDIINRLVEVEGVVAIRNLVLTRYDAQGRAVLPSEPWRLALSFRHQPRLYLEQSKFLFFKNELPFLPANWPEVWAVLQQLRSTAETEKGGHGALDLPVPTGTYHELEEYFPVQYSFPLTYGIGFEGLPEQVSLLRKAQARQLKAYLLFFEQLLVNYLAQLANSHRLFSLDPTQKRSYFTRFIGNTLIQNIEGTEGLYTGLTPDKLNELAETEEEGLRRRNRFLSHQLARFGEQFTDYALLLYTYDPGSGSGGGPLAWEKQVQEKLLGDKARFLQKIPQISAQRGQAVDYHNPPGLADPENTSGLQERLILLLGLPEDTVLFVVEHLLLRPRVLGQVLLPVCLDPDCTFCGEEDPYSFQLTLVLPGWLPLFRHLEFRRFAERQVRLETPAHLLAKICWVGNEVCRGEGDAAILCLLRRVLEGHLKDPSRLEELESALCRYAEEWLEAYNEAFRQEFVSGNFQPLTTEVLERLFDELLPSHGPAAELETALKNTVAKALKTTLTTYFLGKENCFQFNLFRKSWAAWGTELLALDPYEPALEKQVEALLAAHFLETGEKQKPETLCACASALAAAYADALRNWLDVAENQEIVLKAADWRKQLTDLFVLSPTESPQTCPALPSTFFTKLKNLLVEYYRYKLPLLQTHARLVRTLGQLKSMYPPATLHDCEDGNDDNPVRLDATFLG
ncbi:hypothetical protein [Rufibacter hautae]|uniref:Uncharacterized protein n=1 Tax=Rufibacter hautae TaxID=2595005 RepID=A0A5B6THT7_9BACT|nr:hypothetical protein [Rufibacter hautae]KAA3438750.1 hypothetical protein FOA19_16165 [Rufibacter hautae]